MKNTFLFYFFITVLFILPSLLNSQDFYDPSLYEPNDKHVLTPMKSTSNPYLAFEVHKNGRFWNTIMNNSIIGNYFGVQDPDLQLNAPNYYFPRYSHVRHGFNTSLWVGGIVNGDTLVSTALDVQNFYWVWWIQFYSELWPDIYPYGDFRDLSNNTGGVASKDDFARSQITYQAVFTDTFQYEDFIPFNTYDGRKHRPLDIEIKQTSYTWSYKYAEDFMIIDYVIHNIGLNDIEDVYLGLYHVGANHYTGEQPAPKLDAIPGFIDSVPYEFEELGYEKINSTWTIDVDGWSIGSAWYPVNTRNAFGIAPLDLPDGADNISFNWWFNGYGRSWGPRRVGTISDPLRMFNGDLGAPTGDKNKYYMMSHHEIDYNGYYAALNQTHRGWLEPFEYADDIVDGFLVYYLNSFGPFDLKKGEAEKVTIVMSIGEDVHTIPSAYREYFDPNNPHVYTQFLDFSDLIDNIRWAKRIYDNPGVDTDFDGDSGKYFFQVDTLTNDSIQIFYEGDGIPDFRGATPPPPPEIRVTASDRKIVIRWNGRETENYFDTFSLIKDFEGYRVYIARSTDENDVVLMASYDQENYNRYKWNAKFRKYELKETPFTMDELRDKYGEDFEPLEYTRTEPLDDNGNIYYFSEVDYNESYLLDPEKIHKIYPDAINDTTDLDEEGRMRFYEYEYVIDDLLPTIPYYVSVTAFDFGHPAKSLTSLESSKEINRVKVFAIEQGENVLKENKLNVYCYPNPYRVDDDYFEQGFENRFTDLHEDRARAIYFANLPNRCTISIFSIDGDLVRRIEHNEPEGSGEAAIEAFDLITRNTQAIESGLYYWVVESAYGNQVGKLAIIK